MDPESHALFVRQGGHYTVHNPVIVERRIQTRSSNVPWYDLDRPVGETSTLHQTVPATMEIDPLMGSLVRVNYPDSPLIAAQPTHTPGNAPISNFKTIVQKGIKNMNYEILANSIRRSRMCISCQGDSIPETGSYTFSWALYRPEPMGEGSGSLSDGQVTNTGPSCMAF